MHGSHQVRQIRFNQGGSIYAPRIERPPGPWRALRVQYSRTFFSVFLRAHHFYSLTFECNQLGRAHSKRKSHTNGSVAHHMNVNISFAIDIISSQQPNTSQNTHLHTSLRHPRPNHALCGRVCAFPVCMYLLTSPSAQRCFFCGNSKDLVKTDQCAFTNTSHVSLT